MTPLLKLEEQLVKIRQASEERDARRRADASGVEYLDVGSAPVSVEALNLIPEDRAHKIQAAVFEVKKPKLALAVYDPDNLEIVKLAAEFKSQGYQPKIFVVSERGLKHLWSFYRFSRAESAPITSRVNIEEIRISKLTHELVDLEKVNKAVGDFDFKNGSVTEFLEIVLAGALANRSSDIHFEPEEDSVKLRYRIDGLLHDVATHISREPYPPVVSRLKLLSNLKINVKDRPQDGRFTIGLPAKDIEIRTAIAPSEFGEIIVMRVLDPDVINLSLADLGLRADDLEIIETELKRPNGMILNTGPTGSGKTTTLYAFLKKKQTPEIKIITIEDPIEYHLPGIEQTQVDEEAGYTFANGLKSIMRQDPDAILVGEVRDKNTAEIAIQAALTGHLVFSTIHANEASGAVPRLLDLGVKPSSIGPALNLVIAQRLLRRLCLNCRKPEPLSKNLKEKISRFLAALPERVNRKEYENITVFKPLGCEKCGRLGYRGRLAAFELLLNDPDYEKVKTNADLETLASEEQLEALINKQAPESEIAAYALSRGMVTMQQDGVLKVLKGLTTFEEVVQATGLIPWLDSK